MAVARPTYDGAPYQADADKQLRRTADTLALAMAGKVNAVTDVTLAANAATTTLTDARIGYFSAILLEPMTANAAAELGASRIGQVVNTETGALATGTTVVPQDDTIPQSNEGDQYMSLAITPQNASSMLLIDVVFNCALGIAGPIIVALFQDAGANALAAVDVYQVTATGQVNMRFSHKMTAGTTSATTFKVRAGPVGADTLTFNGAGAARRFGGVMASSMTLTEVLPAAGLSIPQATILNGSAVIQHANNPQADRTFRAVILG